MSRKVTAYLPKHVYLLNSGRSFVVSMSHQGKAYYFGSFSTPSQAIKVATFARRALGKEV